jgi:ferric-dicitrate binding protein FerR (iron transport regulator)
MSPDDKQSAKQAKKQAKAEAKAAKKRHKLAETMTEQRAADATHADTSPAERSARAAEQKVRLERWRVGLAALGTLAAIVTGVLALRSC